MGLLLCIVMVFVIVLASKIAFLAALAYMLATALTYLALSMILFVLVVILLVIVALLFLVEPFYCKIKNAWASFRRSPLPEMDVWPGWETIAELTPGGADETFQRVIICDSNRFDDPLHPHVSIIYMIGVKKHASYWRTFTIWRVSTMTGRREYVSRLTWFDPMLPFIPDMKFRVIGFYSRNAIFVHVWHVRGCVELDLTDQSAHLFVYDIRHKKWAKFSLCHPLDIGGFKRIHPTAIFCLGRKVKHGRFDGWRIRFVAWRSFHLFIPPNLSSRIEFVNVTVDLSLSDRSSPAIISREDVVFRDTHFVFPLRSEFQFGLIQRYSNGNQIYVYHTKLNRFQMFQNLEQFMDSDATLSYIRQRGIVMYNGLQPMVLNDREIIDAATEPERDRANMPDNDNSIPSSLVSTGVMRVWLKAPTLRMAAAQSAFKNIPALTTMNADQFRRAIGVDLGGHFMR